MGVQLANNVISLLVAPLSVSDTSLFVRSEDADLFPAVGGEDYAYATISIPGVAGTPGILEIVRLLSRSANEFLIDRGVDDTTAEAFPEGATIGVRINAASVREAFITNYDVLLL